MIAKALMVIMCVALVVWALVIVRTVTMALSTGRTLSIGWQIVERPTASFWFSVMGQLLMLLGLVVLAVFVGKGIGDPPSTGSAALGAGLATFLAIGHYFGMRVRYPQASTYKGG